MQHPANPVARQKRRSHGRIDFGTDPKPFRVVEAQPRHGCAPDSAYITNVALYVSVQPLVVVNA
jgi:hypothetical protein